MNERKSIDGAGRIRRPLRWRVVGLILLTAARLAYADPAPTEAVANCPVSDVGQARALADRSLEQGAYQLAGECYRVAGEYELANEAFVHASRTSADAGTRQLADDRVEARAQWQRLQASLHRVRH